MTIKVKLSIAIIISFLMVNCANPQDKAESEETRSIVKNPIELRSYSINGDSIITHDPTIVDTVWNSTIISGYGSMEHYDNIYAPTINRYDELVMAAPTLLTVLAYKTHLQELGEQHIGWKIIIEEDEHSSLSMSLIYEEFAKEQLDVYEYGKYPGGVLRGLDKSKHIDDYFNILQSIHGIYKYERAEKIYAERKPTFEGFIEWAWEYYGLD